MSSKPWSGWCTYGHRNVFISHPLLGTKIGTQGPLNTQSQIILLELIYETPGCCSSIEHLMKDARHRTPKSLDCPCGRSFSLQSAMSNHQKWRQLQPSHYDHTTTTEAQSSSTDLIPMPSQTKDTAEPKVHLNPLIQSHWILIMCHSQAVVEAEPDDSHLSVIEQRPWSSKVNCWLPLRFIDELSQALPSLPPRTILQPSTAANIQRPPVHFDPYLATQVGSHIHHIFTTPRNIFGLSHHVYRKEMLLNDPKAHINLCDLSNIYIHENVLPSLTFYLSLNRSAFMMGDWFWNSGIQKSLCSFYALMDIIGNSKFKVENVCKVN